ncbi:hypothetical protein ACFL6Y_06945 [Elusimicrobiota bacterium]
MDIFDVAPCNPFRAGVDPVKVEVMSDPYLIVTRMGYAPMVTVKNIETSTEESLRIASQSITVALEGLRANNGGNLKGLKFEVSKETPDVKSKYILKPIQ